MEHEEGPAYRSLFRSISQVLYTKGKAAEDGPIASHSFPYDGNEQLSKATTMPRGSSSSENIHSDYREAHETSSSTITTLDNSTLDIRSNHDHHRQRHHHRHPTPEYLENDRVYSNITAAFDPSKNIIFTKFFNSTRANYAAYENLCSGCGYGVFEARGKLCNFCQYVVNGYLEDNSSNNIYENICDKCSELYSGSECSVCSRNINDKVNRATDNDSSSSKSTSKKSSKKRLFHSLLGSLKRVKSFSVTTAPVDLPSVSDSHPSVNVGKSTIRKKLEIVHNVDGYENVFRTNETFDLNRICELKRLKSSTSDHHIYGKLRKSDDHLQQVPYECVKQKSQSDDYLIGGGCSSITGGGSCASGGGCDESLLYHRNTSVDTSRESVDNDSLCYYLRHEQRSRPRLEQTIAIPVPRSVSVWLTSLRSETHEYYSYGAPDTLTCNPKSIPAVAADPSAGGLSSYSVTLRSFDDEVDFAQQMVNEFKRSLMERQEAQGKSIPAVQHLRLRRQGIYLKLDEGHSTDENKQEANNYRTDLVGGDHIQCNFNRVQATTAQSPENSRRGLAHQLSKRCCIYEKDSEFVVDILQAFDSFLQRESPDDQAVIAATDERETYAEQTSEVLDENKSSVTVKSVVSFAPVLPQQIDFEAIFHALLISRSLNKIVLCYDIPLKVFLSAVDQSTQRSRLRTPRAFQRFIRFQVSRAGNKCNNQSSVNALPAIDYTPEAVNSRKSTVMTVPNGSTTSHTKIVTNDADDDERQKEEEEPIYQPIWKFKTVGEVQENYIYYTDDHLPRSCDSSSAAIVGANIEDDHDEWESDDEFTFTTKLDRNPELEPEPESKSDTSSVSTTQSSSSPSSGSTITGYASSISTMTIASGSSVRHHLFRNICIFYSPIEPKIRAVLYDYDRNRCSSYFAQQRQQLPPPQLPVKQSGRGASHSAVDGALTETDTDTARVYNQNGERAHQQLKKPKVSGCASESGCRMIPDSVQAWKYMLLDANYLEDEEDMIVSESQILRAQTIKEMETSPPPVGILQRFKSISSGNLLDMPPEEDKKSITERVRDKLQRGVLKLQVRSPKESKKSRNLFRRKETTSLYLEDSIKPKYPIFNAPLEQLEMNETSYPDVPRFVVDCIEYIEQKDCIQIDGLYRASGNKVAVDELKQKLTESYIYDPKLLITDDIHTLTSLLKQFFRELGAPLIPQDIYQRLARRNLMESSAIESMKAAFKEMKNPNRATLKFLIKHLTTVAHYSNENRMPASNLAIVWGPCILSANQVEYDIARMNTLAKVLIENYDTIFGDNERLVS